MKLTVSPGIFKIFGGLDLDLNLSYRIRCCYFTCRSDEYWHVNFERVYRNEILYTAFAKEYKRIVGEFLNQ